MKGNKRVDLLFNIARKATENDEFSDDTGIGNDELIQYVNDAQYRLLSLITSTHPTVFVKESPLIQVNKSQEVYPLPDDTFLENRITSIEYSDTGLIRDLNKLRPLTLSTREVSFEGFPKNYIRRSGNILLSPVPNSTGVLRFNYQRRIAELDIRRARVSAVTLDTNNRTITSLTFDTTEASFDASTLNTCDHICAIDKLGTQKMIKIEIDSVDTNTGVVTISSGFVYEEGSTLDIGDYIVCGFDASTHTELPKICERYLVSYLSWKLFKRDSSEDSFEQRNELKSMEKDIVDSFSDVDDDITLIPMIGLED